ncbi:uncharacterized protein LOC133894862 [Phragmites australis]|uniref:uncharacterized protein LOC133894862 n=1 Tax=Phragmites australis TaxID=29695 RepID=UPI002D786FB9|nr:uncharacterized protein LOC133894862 [Phragmites australis]
MAVVAISWWPLSPWFSPTAAWFIFFNAVVCAIAVMSWGQNGHAPSRRKLCRSASSMVLDRLRSFSIFSVQPAAGGITGAPLVGGADVSDSDDYYYCWRDAEEAPASRVTQVCTLAPETPRPTPGVDKESGMPAATALAEDDAASASSSESEEEDADAEEQQDTSISMDQAYALAQQRRPQQTPSPPASASVATAEATTAAARPRKGEPAKATQRRTRARQREAEEVLNGKAELNARADLFIRQFREELKLQPLNSILSHTHAVGPRASTPTAAR